MCVALSLVCALTGVLAGVVAFCDVVAFRGATAFFFAGDSAGDGASFFSATTVSRRIASRTSARLLAAVSAASSASRFACSAFAFSLCSRSLRKRAVFASSSRSDLRRSGNAEASSTSGSLGPVPECKPMGLSSAATRRRTDAASAWIAAGSKTRGTFVKIARCSVARRRFRDIDANAFASTSVAESAVARSASSAKKKAFSSAATSAAADRHPSGVSSLAAAEAPPCAARTSASSVVCRNASSPESEVAARSIASTRSTCRAEHRGSRWRSAARSSFRVRYPFCASSCA